MPQLYKELTATRCDRCNCVCYVGEERLLAPEMQAAKEYPIGGGYTLCGVCYGALTTR